MVRTLALSLLLLTFAVGCLPAASPTATSSASSGGSGVAAGRTREAMIVEVQNDVRNRLEANYRNDVEALMPFARRAFASDAFVGRLTDAQIREVLQEDIDGFQAFGADLESVAFPDPPKFAQTAERLYAIVPFEVVHKVRTTGERVQIVSFSTGILEREADGFYYLDGTFPIDKMREMFPDLPAGYKHAEQSLTTLTPGRSDDGSFPSSASPTDRTPESMHAEVQTDIRRRVEAVFAGDVETLLHFMPESGKRVAGEDRARESLGQRIETVRALNVDLESVEFPVAPTIYQPSERTFAIVPYVANLRSRENGRRVRSSDYAIGILEPGATEFRYLESGLSLAKLRVIYPDLPAEVRVPKVGVTRVD